jgi:hypothetical protein
VIVIAVEIVVVIVQTHGQILVLSQDQFRALIQIQ